MTTNHDINTATKCADIFERIADSMRETWPLLLEIPSHADPRSRLLDDAGALAASASADILKAGDQFRDGIAGLREAARKLRAIGQGAAVADAWPDIPTAQPITRPLADTSRLERFAKGEEE